MHVCLYVYAHAGKHPYTHTHRRVCVTIVIENGSDLINIASINPLWRPQVGGQRQRSALMLHSQQGNTEAESTLKAQSLCAFSVDVLERAGVLTAANVLDERAGQPVTCSLDSRQVQHQALGLRYGV